MLFHSLISGKNSILQQQVEQGGVNRRVFAGCQLIDWLLQSGEADCRRQGTELCRALLEHGIIQHGEHPITPPQPRRQPLTIYAMWLVPVANPYIQKGFNSSVVRKPVVMRGTLSAWVSPSLSWVVSLSLSLHSGEETSLLWQSPALLVLHQLPPAAEACRVAEWGRGRGGVTSREWPPRQPLCPAQNASRGGEIHLLVWYALPPSHIHPSTDTFYIKTNAHLHITEHDTSQHFAY